jgi:hypothetical protein
VRLVALVAVFLCRFACDVVLQLREAVRSLSGLIEGIGHCGSTYYAGKLLHDRSLLRSPYGETLEFHVDDLFAHLATCCWIGLPGNPLRFTGFYELREKR